MVFGDVADLDDPPFAVRERVPEDALRDVDAERGVQHRGGEEFDPVRGHEATSAPNASIARCACFTGQRLLTALLVLRRMSLLHAFTMTPSRPARAYGLSV